MEGYFGNERERPMEAPSWQAPEQQPVDSVSLPWARFTEMMRVYAAYLDGRLVPFEDLQAIQAAKDDEPAVELDEAEVQELMEPPRSAFKKIRVEPTE